MKTEPLTIPDADGEPHDYAIESATMVVTIKKQDGDRAAYLMVGNESGQWSCECPDATYRKRECKHVKALKQRAGYPMEAEVAKTKTTTAEPAPEQQPAQTNNGLIPAPEPDRNLNPAARQQQAKPPNWTVIRTMAEAIQLASIIGESNALPDVRNKGVALLKILAGAEMGFGPFASLTGVDVIEGKPSVGAHLKAASIKQSEKYDYDVVEQDEAGTVCEVAFYERTAYHGGLSRKFCAGWEKKGSVRMTLEQAGALGLTTGKSGTKNNWRAAPADMLFARCITKGYKRYCPDISGGVRTYDADELDQQQEQTPPPALDAEFTVTAPPAAATPEVAAAIPPEPEVPEWIVKELGELVAALKLDPAKVRARLKEKYGSEAIRELKAEQALEALRGMQAAKAKAAAAG